MGKFSSFLIVVKAGHTAALALAKKILLWMRSREVDIALIAADVSPDDLRARARGRDAVLILGGDGTVVGVCRKLLQMGSEMPPYLGINFGKIGFLAEFSPKKWENCCKYLIAGQLRIRSRLALAWSVPDRGEGLAVNDVVVSRGALARVLPLRLIIEESDTSCHDLGWVRADGVLISSPLGSSGYTLSAHGSLIHPDVKVLAITPICPFFRGIPPVILPADCQIRLETQDSLEYKQQVEACLTIDGQEGFSLEPGDSVIIRSISNGLSQLTLPADSYFGRLHERGLI